jgi:iron(III) transport system permease protein
LVALSWVLLLGPDTGLINQWLTPTLGPDRKLNVYSLWGMIWVKGTVDIPLVYLWLSPSLRSMDPSLEEAGYASGANGLRVLKDISLPLLAPALLATWLITFILSIEDLAVPIFIGLPARVMVFASEIYMASSSPPTDVNLASTYAALLLVISLIGILLYRRATSASEKYAVVSGKAYRPRSLELGRSRWLVTGLALTILFLTVVLPILLMLWNSFMPFAQTPAMEGLGLWTASNYKEIFLSNTLVRSLKNSVVLGLSTGVLVMIVSSLIAWMVIRTKVRFRSAVDFLAFLPVAIPGVVVGISLIWVYLTLPIPIYATRWILLVAYFTRFIPYGVRLSYVGQSQIHPELEEASATSGGSWFQTFRRITLPLLAPTMFAGVAYILVRAFRELPASILLAHSGSEVFSVAIYSLWEVGALPRLAALGIVAVVVLVVAILVVRKITGHYYVST